MTIKEVLDRDIPNASQVFRDIANHPLLRDRVLILDREPSDADVDASVELLHRTLKGQAPLGEMPRANRGVYSATGRVYKFVTVSSEQVPPRPPEDGLIDMLEAYLAARQAPGSRLRTVELNEGRLSELIERISIMREDTRIKSRHVQIMYQQLAILENEAYGLIKHHYEILRPLALSDPTLVDLIDIVEEYFYGAARRAVGTRKERERTFEEMSQKAEQKGMAEAHRKARASITDEMQSMINEMSRLSGSPRAPEPAPTDPRGQKR